MAIQNRDGRPWASLTLFLLSICIGVPVVLASSPVLPRFSFNNAAQEQRQGLVAARTASASSPSAEVSACHSLGESLATSAPRMPIEILSFEASYMMTASGCQTITPPASLASQWSSWTSAVDAWLDVHSSEYTSYLSRCEAWELAASLQCPTGTATSDTTATRTASGTGKPTGDTKDTTDTTDASVTMTTSTATATPNPTSDKTADAPPGQASPTLISSDTMGRPSLTRAAAVGASSFLLLGLMMM